jgi:hypothetical protein
VCARSGYAVASVAVCGGPSVRRRWRRRADLLHQQVSAVVDIFTMSCRALGRGVEHALLARLAREADDLAAPRTDRDCKLQAVDSDQCGGATPTPASTACVTKSCSREAEKGMMMLIRCQRAPNQRNMVCV